jgi:hypothetical protein
MSDTSSAHLSLFRTALASSLANPDTDPDAATVEAAHSSGLHAYVSRLDAAVLKKRLEVDTLTLVPGAPSVEGDPARGLTAFQAAAPVLQAQAKANLRRSIGILIAEVGLVALAVWAAVTFTNVVHPDDPGQPPSNFPLLALSAAIGLMIVSALSGIVYLT